MSPLPPSVDETINRLAASRRILVLGPCGSGKTRLSVELGRELGLEVIHLDGQFWRADWIPTPRDEWRQTVARLAAREEWVMDGTYESTLSLRLPACQAIVYVESHRYACLWRVAQRKLYGDRGRRDAPSGQPLDRAFLRYIWEFPSKTEPVVREEISRHGAHAALIVVRGPRGGEGLLDRLARRRNETS